MAVGAVVFVLAGGLLLRAISAFRRAWRDAEILRVPAIARQTLRFQTSGDMALCLEGPRFGTWRQRCRYACTDEATGQAVAIAPARSGAATRGRRRTRIQRGSLTVPHPGDYVLEVAGLEPADAPGYAVVFMRPFSGRMLRFILTCVLLGMLVVGSLVLAILSAAL